MWCLWISVNLYSIFIHENKKFLQNHNYLVHKVLYEDHIKIKIRRFIAFGDFILFKSNKMISRLGDHECDSEYLDATYRICESSVPKNRWIFRFASPGKTKLLERQWVEYQMVMIFGHFGGLRWFKGHFWGI